ncbi:MAG: sugar phosphate isomerase/epimerase family protein [Armatimonadota bacterium]
MVAQDTARNDGGWGHAFDCGIVTPSAFPETFRGEAPLADVCHRLLRDGFYRALEIVPILDMAGRRGVADAAQTAGVTLVSVAAIPYVLQRIRPGSSDPTVWEDSLARAMRLVDDACEMGIRLQQVTCGPDPGPEERVSARRRLVLFFQRLCEYAARRPEASLALTIEPTDRDVQLKGLIGPTAEAVEVIGTVRRSWHNIGLTLDLAHIPQVVETMEQAVETGKDFLDPAQAPRGVRNRGLVRPRRRSGSPPWILIRPSSWDRRRRAGRLPAG